MYRTELLQDRNEYDAYLDIIKKENVRSYLEIGSANGGSLWLAGNVLPKGSRIVSLSLIKPEVGQTSEHIEACIAALIEKGYDAKWIYGDSRDPLSINLTVKGQRLI